MQSLQEQNSAPQGAYELLPVLDLFPKNLSIPAIRGGQIAEMQEMHDCMDAGVRAMQEQVAEDAVFGLPKALLISPNKSHWILTFVRMTIL